MSKREALEITGRTFIIQSSSRSFPPWSLSHPELTSENGGQGRRTDSLLTLKAQSLLPRMAGSHMRL